MGNYVEPTNPVRKRAGTVGFACFGLRLRLAWV